MRLPLRPKVHRAAPDLGTRLNRRFLLVLGAQLGAGAVLAASMHKLQIIESSDLRRIAEENRVSLQSIPPRRGRIVDRNGVVLATTVHRHGVLLARSRSPDPETSLLRVQELMPITAERRRAALKALSTDEGSDLVPLVWDADWETVARVAANAPALPEIEIERDWTRRYPEGQEFSHVVGYVGIPSEQDIAEIPGLRALQSIPDVRIGKRGVERGYDANLRGRPGTARFEVDSSGTRLRELRRDAPTNGHDLALTLDFGLQRYANRRLTGQVGAAVLMDVESGDLLCMVSTPGFDPNQFIPGISAENWNSLNGHPHRPLFHRALNGEYAPGSTYKLAVALAALEAGERGPKDRTPCIGYTELDRLRFHCWKRGGHGTVAMRQAIQQSCDVYFYHTASDLDMSRIETVAKKLGLGEKYPDLGLSSTSEGLIPTRSWKRRKVGASWTQGDSYNAGIGQGYVLATPLQLAVMTARIANGRWRVRPRMTFVDNPSEPLDIDPNHIAIVQEAMVAVCNEPLGTAFSSLPFYHTPPIAGKTGTSQVRRITLELREQGLPEQNELPWVERNHAMFVGYAPVVSPRYAVAVLIEHGGSGSRAAAPVARDLLHRALTRRQPRPEREAEA